MFVNHSSSRIAPGKSAPSVAPAAAPQQPSTGRSQAGPALFEASTYVQAKAPSAMNGTASPQPPQDGLSRSASAPAGAQAQMLLPQFDGRAEREMLPVQQDQVVDFANDRDQRRNMLRSCPQHNEISASQEGYFETREVNGKTVEVPVGNGPAICGGASVASALVLSSKSPEQAAKNAAAIEKVAADLKPPVTLSAAENDALKHFASGKMSPKDVQQLQQVLNRMVRNTGEPNPTSGASREQMAGLLARLSKEGAFQGSMVQMHLNDGHWTCTCDGTHVDTLGAKDKTGKHTARVQGGPPPEVNRQRETWEGEVSLYGQCNPPCIELALRKEHDPKGTARIVPFDVKDYQTPTNADVGDSTSPLYRQGNETVPRPR